LSLALPLFTVGLAAGGVTSTVVIWAASGLVSHVADPVAAAILVAVGLFVLAQETRLTRVRLPNNRRQVPQEVFTDGPYRAAVQFGFELGTGVRTYLPSSVPYLLVVALLLLQPTLGHAVVAGASFGLGRAAMTAARNASPDVDRWDIRLRDRLRAVQPAAALTGIAAVAILAF
jgi:hypothetical protein